MTYEIGMALRMAMLPGRDEIEMQAGPLSGGNA
jgi:hypothetical protein